MNNFKKIITIFVCITIILTIPTYAKKGDSPSEITRKLYQSILDKDFKTFKEIHNTHIKYSTDSNPNYFNHNYWGSSMSDYYINIYDNIKYGRENDEELKEAMKMSGMLILGLAALYCEDSGTCNNPKYFDNIKTVKTLVNFKQIIKEDKAIVILESKIKKTQRLQYHLKKINNVWVIVGYMEKLIDKKGIFGTLNWEDEKEETSELIEPDGNNE